MLSKTQKTDFLNQARAYNKEFNPEDFITASIKYLYYPVMLPKYVVNTYKKVSKGTIW